MRSHYYYFHIDFQHCQYICENLYYDLIRSLLSTVGFAVLYFLTCVIITVHVIAISWTSVHLSVRLSVCLSVRLLHAGIKTAEHIVMLSSPHDSPFILVLCVYKIFVKFRRDPCGGTKQRWGMKMSQFSTNNLLCLRNG